MTLKTVLLAAAMALSLGVGLAQSNAGQVRRAPAAVSATSDTTGIFNAAALGSFFRQLAATEAHNAHRPVRIMQYGDSHTKADLFTGAVRRSFQRDFAGDVYLVAEASHGAAAAGEGQTILYEALGVNGARAKRLRALTEDASFLQALARRKPSLIVLAYGTNEVTDEDWTVESYERMFVEIINRCRAAAPTASVLIVGPPDRAVRGARGWASVRRMPELIEAQRRAALSAGAAFWSASDAMGGAGSMNVWVARGMAQPDHVHFTAAGYSRLGAMFYSDLMNAYRRKQPDTAKPALSDEDLRFMRGVPITRTPR
ncbi:MAG TPA: SGNH/GDSL hydrolase family protein [Pyrinomonadaceae bacterium]|jgi:lysophospholipase L1-like esterase